jgi:hypothetical protein
LSKGAEREYRITVPRATYAVGWLIQFIRGCRGIKKWEDWKASSVVIPSIPGKYLRGLIADGEEWEVALRPLCPQGKKWYQPKDVLFLLT